MLPIVALSAHQLARWPWLLPVSAVAGMSAITSLLLVHRLEPSAADADFAGTAAGQRRPGRRSRPASPAPAPACNATPAHLPRPVPAGAPGPVLPLLTPPAPRPVRSAPAHGSWRTAPPGPPRFSGTPHPGRQPVTAGAPGAADGPG